MPEVAVYTRAEAGRIPWPETPDGLYARDYLGAILENGCEPYIRNVRRTELRVALAGRLGFPLPLTEYDPQNSYPCSPYNHYVAYGGYEEVQRLKNPPLERLIRILLGPLAAYLRRGQLDRVVYVNNWLLSTNLYPSLNASAVSALAKALPKQHPERAIVFRSVDAHRNPLLLQTLRECGYQMVLSRQVWYMDPAEAARTRQYKEDRRELRDHPYEIVEGQHLSDAELERAVQLYNWLYLDKYSPYNPQFTPAFFRLARDRELLRFRALRQEGRIDGIMGYFVRNGLMTQPVFGYDTALPQERGLYRLLTVITLQEGLRLGLTVHASAGVGPFKKLRGGKSTIEYNAVYTRHLPAWRRAPWRLLRWIAERAAPIFQKNNF
jgi:hypothetical protein